jgi:hypothetical protein
MDNNPIAMPTPFGYLREETLNDILREYEESAGTYKTLERQVGGTHYKKCDHPWTIAQDWGLDPWSHNVGKYILRFPYKNGKEDLKKIQHYLEFLIENYDEVNNKYYK